MESQIESLADTIMARIQQDLPDARIQVEDVRGDGQHYAVHVVSSAFAGQPRVRQHQMVYQALDGLIGGALHAIQLTTAAE
jgi:stress-induced morphogen